MLIIFLFRKLLPPPFDITSLLFSVQLVIVSTQTCSFLLFAICFGPTLPYLLYSLFYKWMNDCSFFRKVSNTVHLVHIFICFESDCPGSGLFIVSFIQQINVSILACLLFCVLSKSMSFWGFLIYFMWQWRQVSDSTTKNLRTNFENLRKCQPFEISGRNTKEMAIK